MRKFLVLLLILSFFGASLSYAKVFKIKNIWEGVNQLRAIEKSSGKPLWQSKVQVKKIDQSSLRILEEGGGLCGKEKTYLSWRYESYYHLEGTEFKPEQIDIVYKNKNGEILKTLNKSFDYKNGKIICNVNGKKQVLKFKDNLVDRENLGLFLSNYPFEAKKELSFHLLTHDPLIRKMTVKYKGQETIKNGKETVRCHKLEMAPDLGLLKILNAFVPKIYFWFESKPPHNFIKYEGLESGLGSPYIILESRDLARKTS